MADVELGRIGELLRSVLELLWNKPEGMPAKDLIAYLPQVAQLTEYEKGYAAPGNLPRYEKIVRLSTIPLVHAGWLVKNNKGRWYITEEGREACRKHPNAEELYKAIAPALEKTDAKTQAEIEKNLTALKAVWPSVEPPAAPRWTRR